ncbi:hypothetical protein DOY81_007635 [Sarcophaga bullata]|nr:hypothetical protein DOY81_007635 [Sarcophaga bullata]
MKSGLNQYFEEVLPSSEMNGAATDNKQHLNVSRTNSFNRKVTLSQYFEKELLEETSAEERLQKLNENIDSMYETNNDDNNDEDEEIDIYTSYASYMSSSDPGSDNLLVTFDYGVQDSLEADFSLNSQELDPLDYCEGDKNLGKSLFKIPEEESTDHLLQAIKGHEMISKSPNIFKVHQVLHSDMKKIQSSSQQILDSTCTSLASSLVEYNIDTSGDYGSWEQEPESEGDDDTEKSKNNYRYEDLIKNEMLLIDDNIDDNGDDAHNGVNTSEVLINFNFDEDLPPPHWFNHTLNKNFNNVTCNHDNQPLYYKSVDYLN